MFNFLSRENDIDCEELEILLSKGYKLIDVRTKDEYQNARIIDCHQIDFYAPDFQNRILTLDKNGKYIIYCRSGNRSRKTVSFLTTKGYKEVKNLKGGIIEWHNSGRKIMHD